MGLLAGELLGLELPRGDKRLLAIVETDGCVVDGIAAATACSPGRRTLRIEDYGKVAATFVDVAAGSALRIVPSDGCRRLASEWAPGAANKWQAQLAGYQRMPAAELLSVQEVRLRAPLHQIISRAGLRVSCAVCGEEIMNERGLHRGDFVLCRSCAGESYYDHVLTGVRVGQPHTEHAY